MPGPEESRTPYPLLAKQMLYQMSYRPFKNRRSFLGARFSFEERFPSPKSRFKKMGPDGLEPSTPALSTLCSTS